MSEDLTKTIPQTTDEQLKLILTTVLSTSVRVDNIDLRLEKVVADVAQLQEGQLRLEEGQQRLEEGQIRLEEGQQRLEEGQEVLRSEVETVKRSVNHRFLILSGQAQVTLRDLDRRVTVLELNANPPNSQT